MRIVLGLLILLLAGPAAAQTAYLPLEIGNEWTYGTIVDPPDAPPDTINVRTYALEETADIDGVTYYEYDYPFAFSGEVRIDADGVVWQRHGDSDVTLFDFSLDDGETYAFADPNGDLSYEVSVERSANCNGLVGTFEDCVAFSFDSPTAIDEERSFTFARDVGLIYAYGSVGDWSALLRGRVGGEPIPTSIEPHEPLGFSCSIYPNPAPGIATVRFAVDKTTHASVSVYDALGRLVNTLADRTFPSGAHELSWQAHRRAPGVYFVVVETPTNRSTRSLILTH